MMWQWMGHTTGEVYWWALLPALCVCEAEDSVHKDKVDVCGILHSLSCVNDRTISVCPRRRIIHTFANLQSSPAFLTSPCPPRPTSLLCSETKAERLASSWWLHPGPVDSNPAGVFQDIWHKASQTHLLRPQCSHPWISESRKLQSGSFYTDGMSGKCAACDRFNMLNMETIPHHEMLHQGPCGTTGAFLFVWLFLIDAM